MSTFTSTADLNMRWRGFHFLGPAGTVHRFSDVMYEEFMDDTYSLIPGCVVVYPTEGQGSIQQIFNSNYITQIIGGSATTGTANWVDGRYAIELLIDGNGSSVSTGFKGFIEVPANGVITAARLFGIGSSSGSAVVDIWKDSYANYAPTAADSICGSAKPTITASNKAEDTTLTGWTTDLASGDVIGFNVDSISGGFTGLLASLTVRRA